MLCDTVTRTFRISKEEYQWLARPCSCRDMSGAEIAEGKGATVRITFHDARKGVRELDVTDAEAEKMGGRQVARRGRRPKSATSSARSVVRALCCFPALASAGASEAGLPWADGSRSRPRAGESRQDRPSARADISDEIERDPVLIVPNRADVDRIERDLLRRTGALLAGSIGTFDDVFRELALGASDARPVTSDAQRALCRPARPRATR